MLGDDEPPAGPRARPGRRLLRVVDEAQQREHAGVDEPDPRERREQAHRRGGIRHDEHAERDQRERAQHAQRGPGRLRHHPAPQPHERGPQRDRRAAWTRPRRRALRRRPPGPSRQCAGRRGTRPRPRPRRRGRRSPTRCSTTALATIDPATITTPTATAPAPRRATARRRSAARAIAAAASTSTSPPRSAASRSARSASRASPAARSSTWRREQRHTRVLVEPALQRGPERPPGRQPTTVPASARLSVTVSESRANSARWTSSTEARKSCWNAAPPDDVVDDPLDDRPRGESDRSRWPAPGGR